MSVVHEVTWTMNMNFPCLMNRFMSVRFRDLTSLLSAGSNSIWGGRMEEGEILQKPFEGKFTFKWLLQEGTVWEWSPSSKLLAPTCKSHIKSAQDHECTSPNVRLRRLPAISLIPLTPTPSFPHEPHETLTTIWMVMEELWERDGQELPVWQPTNWPGSSRN